MSSSALAAGVRQIRDGIAAQRCHHDSDEQLLHAFTDRHDDIAFAALVRRHGPMVMGVCRRVLRHTQDAEDAFQAAFLVLARNAATLRNKTALPSFLHGTAYRLAVMALRSAARRRKHEHQAPVRSTTDPSGELLWREVRTLLDEEIARLPEIYRSVFVLCCLENQSQAEAARRLGLKLVTVSSRLAGARKRLGQRLSRRGVELSALLAATALTTDTASALPAMLLPKASEGAVSPAVAALVNGGSAILSVGKIKLAVSVVLMTSVLMGAAVCGFALSRKRPVALPQPAAREQGEKPKSQTPQPDPAKKQEAARQTESAVVTVKGRVLLPNGKPAANATIVRRQMNEAATALEETKLTTTDADGRFEVEHRDSTTLLASAPGFAPDWTGQEFQGGDLTLTLAEPATMRGRLINLEGKPVAGARVKVLAVKVPVRGNLKAVKAAFRLNPEWTWTAMPKQLGGRIPGSTLEAKTDADGRFELEGFGKNRVVELRFEAEGIESAKVHVILAADFDPKSVLPRPSERSGSMSANYRPTVYGPRFTHAVRPCQVITGAVTDDVSGKPITGVKIVGTAASIRMFDNAAWHDAVETVTDRDGRYLLNGLPKAKERHLHLQPGDAPYLDRLIDVPDGEKFSPVRVDAKLHRAVVIEGRLVDKVTGKGVKGDAFYLPLKSAALERFLLDHPAYNPKQSVRPSGVHAFTDADGRFKLRVPPVPGVILAGASTFRDPTARYTATKVSEADRKYLHKPSREGMPTPRQAASAMQQESFNTHLQIHPLGWENGYAVIQLTKKDETVKGVIRFDPGRTIHGKIVGPDGRSLTAVQAVGVQATEEHGPTTLRTDAFTVYALDRPRTLYFRHEGKNLVGTVTLRGDETEAPLVKMQPAAGVIGRVLDAAGKPMAGMEVSIQFSEFGADQLIRQKLYGRLPTLATTGADGRFRLEGMFPGLEFEIFAGHPGHRSLAVSFTPVILKVGEVRDGGDFRVKPPRSSPSGARKFVAEIVSAGNY